MKGALTVIGALALIAAIVVGIFAVRWVTAEPRGKLGAREEILSGSSRIAAYNHFFDLCASVQATEAALGASTDELAQATDHDDIERLRTNITALTAQRARSIAQYNADSRKDYTIGQFRDLDLPYRLPTDAYVKGATISCVA